MGIVEKELAAFELESGTKYVIEYNASGKIHVHIDDLRVGMTKEEFKELVELSENGYQKLMEYKETQ